MTTAQHEKGGPKPASPISPGRTTVPSGMPPGTGDHASFVKMIVPLAANMPPTPWQTEIFAPSTWAGEVPRI